MKASSHVVCVFASLASGNGAFEKAQHISSEISRESCVVDRDGCVVLGVALTVF